MAFKQPPQILSLAKGNLNQLLSHSKSLLAIQSVIRKIVPGDIFVAALTNGELHLITPSAALATRIKYTQAIIISSLRQRHQPYLIESIKISVRPGYFSVTKPASRPLPVSAKSAEQIAETAKYIEDSALRKALIRLAAHVKPVSAPD